MEVVVVAGVAAASAYGRRLDWEPYRWVVLILRRMQVAVVRTVTTGLTRVPFGVGRAERLYHAPLPAPGGAAASGA